MAGISVILDASALVAYLDPRERHHRWAVTQAHQLPNPWITCEAALSESLYLLEGRYWPILIASVRRNEIRVAFNLSNEIEPILTLMEKYADVPMSLADACIVRMTEVLPDPLVLTTDSDFRLYRRHGRQVVPVRTP
jgi:predicted nucleic acid-binding protein